MHWRICLAMHQVPEKLKEVSSDTCTYLLPPVFRRMREENVCLFTGENGMKGGAIPAHWLTNLPFPSLPSSLGLSLRPPLDRTGVPLPPLSPTQVT